MKIKLLLIGKTAENTVEAIIADYTKRVNHYLKFDIDTIAVNHHKNDSAEKIKQKEASLILKKVETGDWIVLLDDKGKMLSSEEFATQIAQWMLQSKKQIVFIVGGAYGFSEEIYAIAHQKISLSKMTFSHQIIRIVFMEQLYRAFTIIHNEPYHHA